MNRSISILIFSLFSLTLFGQNSKYISTVKGDGNIQVKRYDLQSFVYIDVLGNFDRVNFSKKDTSYLTIECDSNLLGVISFKIKNDTLVLSTISEIHKSSKLEISIYSPFVRSICSKNSANLFLSQLEFDALSIELRGSSRLNASDISCNQLNIKCSKASSLQMHGKVNSAHIRARGSAELNLSRCAIDSCKVELSGVCEAHLNLNSKLTGYIKGGSSLFYKGHVTKFDLNVIENSSLQFLE